MSKEMDCIWLSDRTDELIDRYSNLFEVFFFFASVKLRPRLRVHTLFIRRTHLFLLSVQTP